MIFCSATLTSVLGKSFGDESPFLLVKLVNDSEVLIGKMYQKHWPIHHVYFFLEKKITFIRFPSSTHVELLPIQCHPELLNYLCTCLVNIGREKLDQIPLLEESELGKEKDLLADSNLTKEMINSLLIREKLKRLVKEEEEDFEL